MGSSRWNRPLVSRRVSWRSRGQTLVIVALMLPLLVLMLGVVIDVASLATQTQRVNGAAQLAADAGATIASRDVLAILLARHWCQPAISFAAWDTTPCAAPDPNQNSQSLANLEQDCFWVPSAQQFTDVTVSDSSILASCIGQWSSRSTGWMQAISSNLSANGYPPQGSDTGFGCAGACGYATSGTADCSSDNVLCIEVTMSSRVTWLFLGALTGNTSHAVTVTADASLVLPGSCAQLKTLIMGGSGACPVQPAQPGQ